MLPSLRYTYDFVRCSLPAGTARVLEVGCGSGELAALLMADGLEVSAIDADAERVAEARRLGVDSKMMRWPVNLREHFDAILFTRSLHHVDDLPGSIAAAVSALNPEGRMIVEDFRAEGSTERSQRWFESVSRELHAQGELAPETSVEALLDKAAPSSTHDHHLHSCAEIARELGRAGDVTSADAAYYFRYLEPCLSDDGAEFLELELAMIGRGAIDALGKRFVVQPR